jgi:DNA polymerase
MAVDGRGRRKILVVGDYPGKDEDREGRPMVGAAGRMFADKLRRRGIELREDCWVMNARSCYGPNAADHKTATTDCRPKVFAAIRDLDPEIIVLAGTQAVRSVIGQLWKEKTGPVGRWAGWRVPCHKPNAWVCAVANPASLFYDDADPVEALDFDRHLDGIAELSGRPWPAGPPDYESQVRAVMDPHEAATRLDQIESGVIAYDFETSCGKPEGPDSRIVCCAVCIDGTETIAFPWLRPVFGPMAAVLTNPDVRKIASNMDFEDRWTRKHLGIEVAGWYWDTMLAAHCLDPRGDPDRKSSDGITGLKFQAFARLGQPAYNDHIEPFLVPEQKGGYALNRIRDIKPAQLLRYCGLDALLEFEVARHQMREMGLELEL